MDYPGKVITKTQVTPTQTSASGNWTLDDQAAAIKNNNWPVALVPNPISKSLRFNPADSAYLDRTFVGTPNTYTLSMWVKRGSSFGSQMLIVGSRAGSSTDGTIQFNTSNQITVVLANTYVITTTAVYRDPAAWYHLVLSVTASGTAYLYINNVQAGSVAVGATCWLFNSTNTNTIGRYGSSASLYYDGYLTEINFIDGQALTPSDFGLTNPQTGQWIPKKYTGTYGTNGFYLNFKDATSTTTLGYDYSGNANNWTTNNFSVTAGSGNDSLTDVPTPWVAYNTTGDVGGVVRGNYCTLNPLNVASAGVTLSNGNLTATVAAVVANYPCASTMAVSSGKWYFESTVTTAGGSYPFIGIIPSTNYLLGSTTSVAGYTNACWAGNGAFANGDICGFAFDLDGLTFTAYKNGVALGTSFYGNPSGGSNTITSGLTWVPALSGVNGAVFNMNFGQRPFAYTPPAGFRSLCTANLPATTIGFGLTNQGDDYFDISLWTGTSATQSITNSGSMQPDFVWTKMRGSASQSHQLYDSVRGVTKIIQTDNTSAEQTVANTLTSFNSNGFTLGSAGNSNLSTYTYVGWQWKAGGTGVTNTAGTITSTVSANTTAGFSIVTYTGTGANATVGHGLGVTPGMIIVKDRSAANDWVVWHRSYSSTTQGYMYLNSTGAVATSSGFWNSTAPTSTLVSLGNLWTNTSGSGMVMYAFAPIAGYSAFGSYTGNASTDGPFIYLGFRPKYILVKQTNTTRDWKVYDAVRNTYNIANLSLAPNLSDAEGTEANNFFDFLSNGFKIRSSGATLNDSGGTFIYACFAESPFQFSNAR